MTLSPQARQTLRQQQQALYLTNQDIEQVEASLQDAQQQRQHMQHQEDLKIYEQMFLEALQRQAPLAESDRQELQYLQEVLQLQPADVEAIEAHLTTLAEAQERPQAKASKHPAANESPHQNETIDNTPDPASIPTQLQAGSSPSPDPATQPTMPPKRPPVFLKAEPHPKEPPPTSSPEIPPAEASDAQLDEVIALPPNIKDLLLRALLEKSQSHLISEDSSPTSEHHLPTKTASEQFPEPALTQSNEENSGHKARSLKQTTIQANDAELDEVELAQTSEQPSQSSQRVNSYRGLFPLIIALATLAAAIGAWLAFSSFNSGTNSGKSNAKPEEAKQYASWGTQKMQQGQYEAAVKDFTQAVQLDPDAAAIYVNRGLAQHRMGDLGAAAQDYDKAIALNPQLAEAYNNRSHVRFEQKQYEAALEDANSAVALKSTLAEARLNLANARLALKNPQGAVEDYTLGIQLSPAPANQPGAYNNRGNALAVSDPQAAIGDYNQAIELNSSYADAYRNRGLAYQKLGNTRSAIQDLQTAAKFYLAQGNQDMYQQTLKEVTELQQVVPNSPTPEATSVVDFSR
ncbi:tetratricopeptide repeat protein [Pantanalinema sp. GBBB05]|uniref:tetratricopeptide repeat protein n=1 Tax=Pantanalinema sp. GBBB05 TaxID=2604139 RepID=UPI001E0215F0|nr:tetratricopeptide repeat protein [Pantanalinema sp. GBBB05]